MTSLRVGILCTLGAVGVIWSWWPVFHPTTAHPAAIYYDQVTQSPGFQYRRFRVCLRDGTTVHVIGTHYKWDEPGFLQIKDAAADHVIFSCKAALVITVTEE